MSIGGGNPHLSEFLATMGMPSMTNNTFSHIEHEILKWWKSNLEEELLEAGKAEKALAIEANDFHEDVPAITVVCDGGWNKRTHKHTYNALGGVGIVV